MVLMLLNATQTPLVCNLACLKLMKQYFILSNLMNLDGAIVQSNFQNPKTSTKRSMKDVEFDEIGSCSKFVKHAWPWINPVTVSEDENCSSMKGDFEKCLRNDGRKQNRGVSHRRSYSIEVKKRAINLRNSGLTIDDVAKLLNTAKSNVEKWCSMKVNFST